MTSVQVAALIVSLTAALAFVNARFVRLPSGIGLMAISLVGSIVVVVLDALGAIDARDVRDVVSRADFAETLLHGLLGLMLFAGALHLDLHELAEQRWPIAALSLGGTFLSTITVGATIYGVLAALGSDVGLFDALLFGALISPTDPIAVMSALKSSRVPRDLAVQISGESLFNDGIGVVLFVVVLAIAQGGDVTPSTIGLLFVRVAIGGAAFGLVTGYVARRMLRAVDDYSVEVLITLALVLGGYALAEAIGVSAPIGAVVAGLVIGTHARGRADSHVRLREFWELVDEVLNAVLFLLLGLEATRISISASVAVAAAIAVPVVLGARFASVAASVAMLRPFRGRASSHAVAILTWGGLRGGLSVALALSLAPSGGRDTILAMTYSVVCFAILIQGMTLTRLLRALGLVD